jgi:hypothetical protein
VVHPGPQVPNLCDHLTAGLLVVVLLAIVLHQLGQACQTLHIKASVSQRYVSPYL